MAERSPNSHYQFVKDFLTQGSDVINEYPLSYENYPPSIYIKRYSGVSQSGVVTQTNFCLCVCVCVDTQTNFCLCVVTDM